MTARLFHPPVHRAFTTVGVPASGEKLFFYLTGGTTATPSYSNSLLTIPHPSPVVADSAGRFPAIFLNDAITYRVVQETSAGVIVSDVDPYTMPVIPTTESIQDIVGTMFVNGTNITATYNDPDGTIALAVDLTNTNPIEAVIIPIFDTATVVTAGMNKFKFRMPYAFQINNFRASLATAQTSGVLVTVDVNKTGASVLSTKLTIDNTELTSVTAATPHVVFATPLVTDDEEISIDVDFVGDGTAKGLNVTIIGRRIV